MLAKKNCDPILFSLGLRTSKALSPLRKATEGKKAVEQFPSCRYYFSHFNSRFKYSKYLDSQPNTLFVSAYIKLLNWITRCAECMFLLSMVESYRRYGYYLGGRHRYYTRNIEQRLFELQDNSSLLTTIKAGLGKTASFLLLCTFDLS